MELVSHEDKITFRVPTGIIRSETEKGILTLNNRCPRFLMLLFSEVNPSHEFLNKPSQKPERITAVGNLASYFLRGSNHGLTESGSLRNNYIFCDLI